MTQIPAAASRAGPLEEQIASGGIAPTQHAEPIMPSPTPDETPSPQPDVVIPPGPDVIDPTGPEETPPTEQPPEIPTPGPEVVIPPQPQPPPASPADTPIL